MEPSCFNCSTEEDIFLDSTQVDKETDIVKEGRDLQPMTEDKELDDVSSPRKYSPKRRKT